MPEETVGQPFGKFLTDNTQPKFLRYLQLIRRHKSQRFAATGNTTRGRTVSLWIQMKLMETKSRDAAILLSIKDLSGHKRGQSAVKMDRKSLRQWAENITGNYVFYTIDPEGRINGWNKDAERVDGYSMEDVMGKNISIFYPQENVKNHLPSQELEIAQRLGGHEVEGWRIRKNGNLFWARVITTPIRNEKNELLGFTRAVRDLSDAKRMNEALASQYNHFKELVENSSDLIAVIDRKGIIAFIGSSVERVLGYPPAACIGRNAMNFIHPGDVKSTLDDFSKVLRRPGHRGTFQLRLLHRNGTWMTFDGSAANMLDNPHIAGIVVNARDLTKIKQLEHQLIKAGEAERNRIASDLHDGLVQQLAGIEFLARVLQHRLETTGNSEAEQAQKIASYLKIALRTTRDLSHKLYPIGLKEGLVHALKILADDIQRLFEVKCLFSYDNDIGIHDKDVEGHCYFIVQEAVKNAVQHGKASRITISLNARNKQICLSVRDDGHGVPNGSNRGEGIGQRVMTNRARMINGSLDLHRNINGGTTVICTFPQA